QELKPEAVDVSGLIAGMSDLLSRALGPAVTLGQDLPAGLPPVRVDANQLELAILNLAVNARDAVPLGGTLSIVGSEERIQAGDSDAPRELPP
ncbi:hypothetical protein OFN25_29830, partial [Escherichia coli]|nr:hypothetical protein [Escherichia coli]